MEKTVPVTCIYTAEQEAAEVLLRSFVHYLEIQLNEPETRAAG